MNHQFIGKGTFRLAKPVHELELNFAEWLSETTSAENLEVLKHWN